LDWPEAGHINERVLREMGATREAISTGLAQRAEAGIKVRQPLASATALDVFDAGATDETSAEYLDIMREELNVKKVVRKTSEPVDAPPRAKLDLKITPELKREGQAREVIRHVQQARKQAGLQVDDRINLHLETSDKDLQAVLADKALAGAITEETLTTSLAAKAIDGFTTSVKVDGAELKISLAKAT
jgi:isoleucyl-tRNA synthetase